MGGQLVARQRPAWHDRGHVKDVSVAPDRPALLAIAAWPDYIRLARSLPRGMIESSDTGPELDEELEM